MTGMNVTGVDLTGAWLPEHVSLIETNVLGIEPSASNDES